MANQRKKTASKIPLGKKIKLALDESRMLILGAQILLGFQFRAMLEKGFESLPHSAQTVKIVALTVQLITIILIMWPGSYHRIVWDGDDSTAVHNFTTRVMDAALLPFITALALEFFAMTTKVTGMKGAVSVGVLIGMLGILMWYGLELLSRWLGWDYHPAERVEEQTMEKTELYDKVEQALIEARVVLPGAQALLGFQFAAMLVEAFDKLPASSKYFHLVSLTLMGVTIILLMTPAAYHRIVERGEATEHFHKVASVLLLLSMITFPLGICGELFVVIRHVTNSALAGAAFGVAALALFYSLWFGFTFYRKTTRGFS